MSRRKIEAIYSTKIIINVVSHPKNNILENRTVQKIKCIETPFSFIDSDVIGSGISSRGRQSAVDIR
jgi:hypothetical protein